MYEDGFNAEPDLKQAYQATDFTQYFDFQRLHYLCFMADKLRIAVSSFEFKLLRRYFVVLQTAFYLMSNVLPDSNLVKKELIEDSNALDKLTFEVAKKIKNGDDPEVTEELLQAMDSFFLKIMKVRQESGFGFPLRKFTSPESRVRAALND